MRIVITSLLLLMLPSYGSAQDAREDSVHVAIVVGTHHYSPQDSMPLFGKELERLGFKVSIINGEGDPERKTENVLPGLQMLDEADVAVFFMRFLQLPDQEWEYIERYIKSGKPVVGLRTANHSFKYPEGHPRFKWNREFGRRVLGTPYIVHQQGTTSIELVSANKNHPILADIAKSNWVSPGSLYLTRLEPGCVPLLSGVGKGRSRIISREFGVVNVNDIEADIVAWTWENEWGAKVFATSLGHPGDFAEESVVRLLVNAICWAADQEMVSASEPLTTWEVQHKRKK